MAVGDLPAEARITPSLKQAWHNIWPSFWWLLLFFIITGLANGLSSDATVGQDYTVTDGVLDGVGAILGVFVGIPLAFGLVKAHLAASRGEKPTWSDLGYAFGDRYWHAIGLGLLSAVIIVAGFILLIIPGIYLAVRLSFASTRFIEDDLDIMDAIKASFADTKGRWWNVFGLALMAFPLIIAGLLALGVGIFVSFVLIGQMQVVYWRAIAEGGPSPSAEAAEAA